MSTDADRNTPAGPDDRFARLRANWRQFRSRPRQRVEWWLHLLILFAPIFYLLLFFKPYTFTARVGWGVWFGLIIFIKLSGLADPVIDVKLPDPATLEEATAYDPAATPPPTLNAYLDKLDQGLIGFAVHDHQVQGETIRVDFALAGEAFGERREVVLATVSTAFSLLYGWDFQRLEASYTFQGPPVRFVVERDAFARFFGMTPEAMQALTTASGDTLEASPLKRMDERQRVRFYDRFVVVE